MADDLGGTDDDKPGRSIEPKTIGLVVLLIALLAFVLDNRDDTRVGFVFFEVTAPLILILIGTAGVGVIIGYLVARRGRRRHRD